jgi:nucleoside-diphosphate-sugar epimerase
MKRILITGGTGFLGQHVISILEKAGHDIRVLSRQPAGGGGKMEKTEKNNKEGGQVTTYTGDLMDAASLTAAVDGVDVIFHCAGGGKVSRAGDFFEQNTVATENLVRAILETNGSPHVIFTSSLSAHGPALDRFARSPSEEGQPVSLYGQAKKAAESILLKHADQFHVTIFRPPAIYGPGDTRWLLFFKSVKSHVILRPPGQTMSLVYGPDCAQAMVRAMEVTPPNGRCYFVDDGCVYTWHDLERVASAALESSFYSVQLPAWSLWTIGALNEIRAAVLNKPVLITRDKWRDAIQAHWICDSTQTRSELDWEPKTVVEDGFVDTIDWYQTHGWL